MSNKFKDEEAETELFAFCDPIDEEELKLSRQSLYGRIHLLGTQIERLNAQIDELRGETINIDHLLYKSRPGIYTFIIEYLKHTKVSVSASEIIEAIKDSNVSNKEELIKDIRVLVINPPNIHPYYHDMKNKRGFTQYVEHNLYKVLIEGEKFSLT